MHQSSSTCSTSAGSNNVDTSNNCCDNTANSSAPGLSRYYLCHSFLLTRLLPFLLPRLRYLPRSGPLLAAWATWACLVLSKCHVAPHVRTWLAIAFHRQVTPEFLASLQHAVELVCSIDGVRGNHVDVSANIGLVAEAFWQGRYSRRGGSRP